METILITNIDELATALGGKPILAQTLNVAENTIDVWKSRGGVPTHYTWTLLQLATAKRFQVNHTLFRRGRAGNVGAHGQDPVDSRVFEVLPSPDQTCNRIVSLPTPNSSTRDTPPTKIRAKSGISRVTTGTVVCVPAATADRVRGQGSKSVSTVTAPCNKMAPRRRR